MIDAKERLVRFCHGNGRTSLIRITTALLDLNWKVANRIGFRIQYVTISVCGLEALLSIVFTRLSATHG